MIVQRLAIDGRFEVQLVDGLRHDQVGQEAGHGLLGAAPGIAGEVIERVEDGAGDSWSNGDGEGARTGIRSGGISEGPLILAGAGEDDAGSGGALLDAEGQDGQRHLQRVRFLIGKRLGSEDGVAG